MGVGRFPYALFSTVPVAGGFFTVFCCWGLIPFAVFACPVVVLAFSFLFLGVCLDMTGFLEPAFPLTRSCCGTSPGVTTGGGAAPRPRGSG